MRLTFTLKVNNNVLPISYRVPIMSFIKHIIESEDSEYYKSLYFYQGNKNKKTKPFTFAVYFNDYVLKDENIFFDGPVKVTLSSSDDKFFITFCNGLMKLTEYTYKNSIVFEKLNIYFEPEQLIDDNFIIFKTMSPIVVKNKDNQMLLFDDTAYSKEFNYICNLITQEELGRNLKKELIFNPIKMKKSVIKQDLKHFQDITKKQSYMITGNSGIFSLEGDKEDLQFLYSAGASFFRNQGFGLLNIY